MNVKTYLNTKLKQIFKKMGIDQNLAVVTLSNRSDVADYQCNSAFLLCKELNKKPIEIAEEIVKQCEIAIKECEITATAPGFVNFILKDAFLTDIANNCIKSERLNIDKLEKPINLVIDFGGANVAKPLHVGHLRSAIIGMAIYRLSKFLGNSTLSDVHLGDWGLQMGLTIAQLMDEYDLGYYFGKNVSKVDITMQMLDEAYPKASIRKKEDMDFYNRASDITLYLQNKQQGYYQIWQEMRRVSMDCVKSSYNGLGVEFDLWNGESTANELVDTVIEKFIDKNLAQESEGALIVDVAKPDDTFTIPPAILKKHNGAQMYFVTDLATILDRYNTNNKLNKILYFTDNRQSLHFTQVFRAVRKVQLIPDNIELKHISFGTVNGNDGKPFKTRDGGVLKLDELINMAKEKALSKLAENGNERNEKLAKQIGLSAIIFGDLINIISKDYVLDIDKFLKFEGKTGPYIQYTAVRIKSLLKKANYDKINCKICVKTVEERNIVLSILRFIESLETSYNENSLNSLCLTLFEVASAFSTLYNNIHILSEKEKYRKNNLLSISNLVLKTLDIGCGILGIEIPEFM